MQLEVKEWDLEKISELCVPNTAMNAYEKALRFRLIRIELTA